jgi:DNA helicase II / ATP-dependent DNA helicase PcrA
MDILAGLNEQQRRAAQATVGPLAIVAGPGTGKTKTLTARLAYLLHDGSIEPKEVVALTFSNKAAKEIRERLHGLLPGSSLPDVFTFHALGNELLRTVGQQRPIIDDVTRRELLATLPKPTTGKRSAPRELAARLSKAKTALSAINASDASLLAAYEQLLDERQIYDFDDLLVHAYRLLRDEPSIRTYRYVVVDEFQDTSELQYELMRLLAVDGNVCVIGDPNQSIYGFRGAGTQLFERFKHDYPAFQTVTLTVNYRSAPQIVAAANSIFDRAPQLTAHKTGPGSIQTVQTSNEHSEAAYVLGEIERGIGGSDMLKATEVADPQALRTYAVLYRTHRAARILQRDFADAGIPYQIVGEGSPYEQPGLQALIGVMRHRAAPNTTTEQQLRSLPPLKTYTVPQLRALLDQLPQNDTLSVADLAEHIAKTFGLDEAIDAQDLRQFSSVLVQFGSCTQGLVSCLAYIDRIAEHEFYDASIDTVTLLTIHSAKGLEFPCVFLCAAEEGILPKKQHGDVHEERRLFYV